jgi:hypothetical protein
MIRTLLPAGDYYIGDLCYVIPDDESWSDFLDGYWATLEYNSTQDYGGGFKFRGRDIFAANTAYGDGSYLGSNDKRYDVDAGLIGALPVELCSLPAADHGDIETFSEPFWALYDNGKFMIGDIVIRTAGEERDEEEDF